MQLDRLSDFSGKGLYLLFEFALYNKIKINISPETNEETEILGYSEGDIPDILHHLNFVENKDVRYLKKLFTQDQNFHYYCPFCKRELQIIYNGHNLEKKLLDSLLTTYSYMWMSEECEAYEEDAVQSSTRRFEELKEQIFDENGILQLNFECTSKDKHKYYVIFQLTDDNCLMKTGQYPSIIDFDHSSKEYKKVLVDKSIAKELRQANILKSYDMGVGAFLYLRRIFEKLIYEQYERAKHDNNINEQDYNSAKTEQKVKLLSKKGYIPTYFSNVTPFVYDILSKGIHQLSEEECNSHFDVLKKAILLILDEKVEVKKKDILKKNTKNQLNKIHSKLPKQFK